MMFKSMSGHAFEHLSDTSDKDDHQCHLDAPTWSSRSFFVTSNNEYQTSNDYVHDLGGHSLLRWCSAALLRLSPWRLDVCSCRLTTGHELRIWHWDKPDNLSQSICQFHNAVSPILWPRGNLHHEETYCGLRHHDHRVSEVVIAGTSQYSFT